MIMMKIKVSWSLFAALIFIVVFVATKLEYEHLKIESQWRPSSTSTTPKRRRSWSSLNNNNKKKDGGVDGDGDFWSLPQGIVHSTSDLELRPLWTTSKPSFYSATINSTALLAIPVGLNQKTNVDHMVNKFLSANCSILLFHYDGNVDAWNDLHWSTKAVHVLAHNQTKWWFAKRFLHPDVVFIYDYIFLWDEDLGVTNFDPGRFLEIMASEGLEISQPALDPDLSEVHHRITIRNRREKFHRRVYAVQGSLNCSEESTGPPCTGYVKDDLKPIYLEKLSLDHYTISGSTVMRGFTNVDHVSDHLWIEGMAPVFSRAAWRCVWHLIQNDLIHGWGLDMKLGYCAQGDRTEKVGVIDSEYVVHHGIPSLGGPSENKTAAVRSLDLRTHVRRQSTAELEVFQKRWDQAVREDEGWDDPFDNMK